MEEKDSKNRIDKWLWTVRFFKTRSIATDACKAGKIKIDGDSVKPAKEIKVGEIISVQIGQLNKQVKVIDFPKNRVAAKLVPSYYEDLTPKEEYQRLEMIKMTYIKRDKGSGRPTKRDRRQLSDYELLD